MAEGGGDAKHLKSSDLVKDRRNLPSITGDGSLLRCSGRSEDTNAINEEYVEANYCFLFPDVGAGRRALDLPEQLDYTSPCTTPT